MLEQRPSLTAEVVCFFRALEERRDPDQRLLSDPFAERLLSPVVRGWLDHGAREAVRRVGVGAFGGSVSFDRLTDFVVARHRFMDDSMLRALEAGAEQVLILGAGYDTRALRFAEQLGGRRVYEVDHPATQREKIERLGAAHGERDHIRYVAVDFLRDDFAAKLRETDFAVGARTFVIWEGVTMYLRERAVRDTLGALRTLVGGASELTADFWYAPPGSRPWELAVRWGARLLSLLGEAIGFGLDPARVEDFFSSEGYELMVLGDGPELERWYHMGERRIFPSLYVTLARVEAALASGDDEGRGDR